MTQVCLLGKPDVNLRYELLSRETARQALATYDLREPFANSVAVETVSLGAAVALLNDLNWYLVRFVDDAFVLEPSVSEEEWLSRDLATAIRDDEVDEDENGRFLAVYGLVPEGEEATASADDERVPDAVEGDDSEDDGADDGGFDRGGPDGPRSEGDPLDEGSGATVTGQNPAEATTGPVRPVEPMLVTRTGGTVPEYDLRDVEDTLVVRLTKAEFGA